jgi:hypothetical protein
MTISVLILFQMPESPSFLLDKGMFFEAQDAYNVIADFNGKRHMTVEIPEDRSFVSEDGTITIIMEEQPTLAEMLQDKLFRMKMGLTILFWIGCEFCFFVISFYMKYLPGNIFSILSLQSIVTAISFTSGGLISKVLGVKRTIAISFSVATIAAYLMIKSPLSFQLPLLILTKIGVDCAYS